ncbi:hypothetical protein V8G54_012326 [Vigna mungo]|uniref:Leucine-rich repeat-containing N-terminal plant-type domain-containing protein n=1 Tax=Vigna mungo TaxID=3915 RepID=A0AAQ3NQW3_VIGMU
MLSTWRDDQNDTDCCRWKGIECNNETGNVEMVDLRGSESHYLSGSINIASLVGLHKLKYLDLSSNHPSSLGDQIPPSIGSFQSLRYLNLSLTILLGTIPYELGNLSKLEYLDLKETYLHGEIPSKLGKLSSLRYLDLSANLDIYGEIPSQLGSLSHLRYLDLSYNELSGTLPFQVGNLPLLHSLKLDGNSDLKIKDENWLSSLSSLTTLIGVYLEENYLEGDINELHLTNLSQLIELDLSDNSLSLNFATTWTPPFQLLKLGLASYKLGPNFPSWLQTQSQQEFQDISDAGINDFVPNWFWNKLQFIREMNMSYNGLKGVIPNLTIKFVLHDPEAIILNSNKLEGIIPTFLSHARTLDLVCRNQENCRFAVGVPNQEPDQEVIKNLPFQETVVSRCCQNRVGMKAQIGAVRSDYAAIRQNYAEIRQDLQEIIRMLGGRGHNQDDQPCDRGEERHAVQPNGKKRVELPTFEGFDPFGWVSNAEKLFELQGVAEEERVRLTEFSMEGSAHYWFKAWKAKAKNRSWEGLKGAMVWRFGERNSGTIVDRVATNKQSGTMEEYAPTSTMRELQEPIHN